MSGQRRPAIDRKDLIEGLGKGLRVIEAFDDDHPRLTASEAARAAGLTRTAARRYLLSLVHFGYAGTDGKQFWLAPRVLRLGQSYLGAARLPRLVQPFIQRVSMPVRRDGQRQRARRARGGLRRAQQPAAWVSIGYHVGARVPAHVVTPGVVMLATAATPHWTPGSPRTTSARFTAHTVTDTARFRADVRRPARRTTGSPSSSSTSGCGGMSVALKDRKGECQGAMGMTRCRPLRRDADAREAAAAAREAAQALRPLL